MNAPARLIPIALLCLTLAGCSKKQDDAGGKSSGGQQGSSKAESSKSSDSGGGSKGADAGNSMAGSTDAVKIQAADQQKAGIAIAPFAGP